MPNATLDHACAQAMALQLAGRLAAAAHAYGKILQAQPAHAPANYGLGMLNVQVRQPAAGLPFLAAAVAANPEMADYWLGLVEALLQAGKVDAARAALALAREHGLSGAAGEDLAARLARAEAKPGGCAAHSDNRPYVVLAPVYDRRSAGIRVMHTLCNELNRCGRTAYLILFRFKPSGGSADFFTPEADTGYCAEHDRIPRLPPTTDIGQFRALLDAAVVIYPEVLQGNPLNARRVVRYVLNYPLSNGYPMLESAGDFIVGFNRQYWPNAHTVARIFVDEPVFNDRATLPAMERGMDCTYVGKGLGFGPCFRIPGSVVIERGQPADKEGLAIMLRHTRYFFTWDVNTQTNADAILCGAILVVPRWAPFTPAVFDTDFGPMPYADSSIEHGTIKIAHLPADHASKRQSFVAALKAAALDRTNTVARLAIEIESFFAARESAEATTIRRTANS